MEKIKIRYEQEYISKEDIREVNLNKKYIDIKERTLNNYNQPQMMLLPTAVLLTINIQNIAEGIVGSLIAEGIVKLFKVGRHKYQSRPLKKVDSSHKIEILKPSLKFHINDDVDAVVIADNEITQVQIQNIFNNLAHFKKGRYIVIIEKDGRIKALTELEFAQLKHAQQEEY